MINELSIGTICKETEGYIAKSHHPNNDEDMFPYWDNGTKKHNSIRICMECGEAFYGIRDQFYCPSCAKSRKVNKPAIKKDCKDCGAEFWTHSANAKRCSKCAEVEKQEAKMRYSKRGKRRSLGSIDRCVLCGKEYTVTSPTQRYCSSECRNTDYRPKKNERAREYSRISETKKRRKQVESLCAYCLRPFKKNTATNVCSDYCRAEQKAFKLNESYMRRGRKNNFDELLEKRRRYREQVKNENIREAL